MRDLIKRIIREEIEIPAQIRRRFHHEFPKHVRSEYKWLDAKRFKNFEEFLVRVIFGSTRDFIAEYGKFGTYASYENFFVPFEKITKKFIMEHFYDEIYDYYKKELGLKEEMKEGELTERCWKGYTQKGMKTMFGKRYPNCVKIKKK